MIQKIPSIGAIIIVVLIYVFMLPYCKVYNSCDVVCRVWNEDGSSACFVDYVFEIQSVDNIEYSYVIGEKFILREGCQAIGTTLYEVDDKVRFKLDVVSFRIKNHRIFPLCFFFITGGKINWSSLIGMK